jgi:uncharacterized protein (TIGR00369 family)
VVEDAHEDQGIAEGTFDSLYGLELTEVEVGKVNGYVQVSRAVQQPFGVVHGGVYCSIAESLASVGTWFAVKDEGKIALGVSNQTSFLRPITEGRINGSAEAIHRGRTTWVWDVRLEDDEGRLCAVSRMTIAVRAPV